MWRASVLTIFPEMFPGPLGVSLAGKALASGLWSLDVIDIRDHATDKHRSVDDTPAGGGPGMVMKADVVARALDSATPADCPRLLMSPRGTPLTQARVEELAAVAPDGTPLGTVTAILNFGAGDLVEIKPQGGGEPLMVPFTDAAVPEIDIAARRMVVVPLSTTE